LKAQCNVIAGVVTRLAREIKPSLLAGVVAGLLAASAAEAQGVVVPNFWDPRVRFDRPDLTGLRTVRFLVDDEFPPLHFPGPDGAPTGFSVELARAACEKLAIACTVQVRRFDTLLDALQDRGGDVVAAAIPLTAEIRARFAATSPYFKIPARFVARKNRGLPEPRGRALQGRSIAVVAGTAHEAYAMAFMEGATIRSVPDQNAGHAAVKAGQVDYLFADGLSLAIWIGGSDAADCCAFVGGPFLESRFFGEGVGFLVRKDDDTLRRALDHALQRLWDDGKYAELYLRFFPIGPF
jgi:polar amino acid transport system substrate-binding protein